MKKIIAVLLVLSLAFAFAACKGKEAATAEPTELGGDVTYAESAGTRPVQADNGEAATKVEEAVVTEVATNAEGATEIVTEVVTEVVTEAPTEAAKAPEGKEEIVAYFNEAINGVKPGAKKIVHKSSQITLNGECQIPGIIDGAMKLLGGADKFIADQLAAQSKGEQTYTGADIKAKFPVEGEDYASKLTASDVQNAGVSWSDDGKYLIVKLVVKSDAKSANVKHGEGHAPKAFNVVLPGIVNDNVPSAVTSLLGGDAEMDYPECQVVAYVNFDTGKVEKAQYIINWTINFGDNIVLPFRTTDLYEIQY